MTVDRSYGFNFSVHFDQLGHAQSLALTDEQAAILWDTMTQEEWSHRIFVNGVVWKDLSPLDKSGLMEGLRGLSRLHDQRCLIEQEASKSPESVGYFYIDEIPF